MKKDYFENESIKVQLQHAFKSFGKWCSFPQEFEATREKITQDTNYYLQLTQRKEKHTKKRKNIANFYVTRNIILQSASPAPVPVKAKANGKPASTPKQAKKLPVTPAKPSMGELKKKLLASPSLPKKYEKFVNLMKNAHRVSDDKEIKATWEFLQKNKK